MSDPSSSKASGEPPAPHQATQQAQAHIRDRQSLLSSAGPGLVSPVANTMPPSPSTTVSSPSQKRYTPQFSAATNMILKRFRGEPSTLTSALSSASASTPSLSVNSAAYEDVKRRLMANMTTSATMTMPKPAATPKLSDIPTKVGVSVSKGPALKALVTDSGRPVATGQKRKRDSKDVDNGDASGASSPAAISDLGKRKAPAPQLTKTKSGRHIQKPTSYNPAAEDAARKRTHLGKRTTEQALCKKCTRMYSPRNNQIVFCDGCNQGWHQKCHEPWIDDNIIGEPDKWFCSTCQPREKVQSKKRPLAVAMAVAEPQLLARGPWPGNNTQAQKREYLSKLRPAELVNMIIRATEIHPYLPIFPVAATKPVVDGASRSLFSGTSTEGLFSRQEANPSAPVNFIRKIPAGARKVTPLKPRSGAGSAQETKDDNTDDQKNKEDSSYPSTWPRAGKGLYSLMPPEIVSDEIGRRTRGDLTHLVDDDDYEAISHILFDENGNKVEENGRKVLGRL